MSLTDEMANFFAENPRPRACRACQLDDEARDLVENSPYPMTYISTFLKTKGFDISPDTIRRHRRHS